MAELLQPHGLPLPLIERIKTAVAEAAMNAIEHGNHFRAERPTDVQVLAGAQQVVVRITDQGGHHPMPEVETPDLQAKLAGLQSPRGWGLFLIRNMADEMNLYGDEQHHTIELIFDLAQEKAIETQRSQER